MEPFVNRMQEFAALEEWWNSPSGGMALLWGRRRVGKTMLLQHFSEDKPTVFFTGAGRPRAQELALLSLAARPHLAAGVRDLEVRPFNDWDDALETLAAAALNQRLLLVLDEFPELVAGAPELPGVLRAFLDRVAGRTELRILVCGSAVRVMESLQVERAPLFGRFSLRLQLHPFHPHEASLMLPDLDAETRAVVWGLLGGTPLYLSWWNADESIEENLLRLFCRPGAPLLTEGQLVLATEADLGGLPERILRAIATGHTKYHEIAGLAGSEPARSLDRLMELRMVERVLPVTEDAAHSRKRIYRLVDNFLAFWLGSIERYRSEIERGLGIPIARVLAKGLDDLMGAPWEEAFRLHLRRLAAAGELGDDVVAVGRWWTEGREAAEIDAVVLTGRAREATLVGEAKWARSVEGPRIVYELERKARLMPRAREPLVYAVCARAEVLNAPTGTRVVTARDIFGDA